MNFECRSADILNYDCDVEKKCHGHGVRHVTYLSVHQVYEVITHLCICLSDCLVYEVITHLSVCPSGV